MGVTSPEEMPTNKKLHKERMNGGRILPGDQMMRNSAVWKRVCDIYAGRCTLPGPGCPTLPEVSLFS